MYKFLPYMTNDYSVGLYDGEVNDIYHSAFGALTEAYQKFLGIEDSFGVMDFIIRKKMISVLDICYGIGYNTKALINECLNKDIKLEIDCVDTDKILMELSPVISSNISFIRRFFNRHRLIKNIKNYSEAKKIIELKNKNLRRYKLSDDVNYIILLNLIDNLDRINLGEDIFSEETKKILADHDNHLFFDSNLLKIIKFLSKKGVYLHLKENKTAFVHNIYYKHLTKRYKYYNKYSNNIRINFYPKDIRKYLLNCTKKYDLVFLDGFTPAKCPCIWTLDFFNILYASMTDDSILITYNMSAPVREGLTEAGFYIGYIADKGNKQIGTIASKNSIYIINKFSDRQNGLLKTKAGIPYRDSTLSLDNGTIIKNREEEISNSSLISSSKYFKEWTNDNEKQI